MTLPDDVREALSDVAARRPLLVITDFDGTLSPIVADPAQAALAEGAGSLLSRLAEFPGVHVAVMSGRGYADLAERVGRLSGVHLIGSHGAEYGGAADSSHTDQRDELVGELEALLAPYEGAFLEIKPVSASVHTRRMTDRDAAAALREQTLAGPAAVSGRTVKAGKEVVEIGVVEADKGVALRRLAEEVGAAAIVYLGDDVTDEDAFAVLGPDDVGIKVGEGPTRAAYRLPDSAAVLPALDHLADVLADGDDDLRMGHWIDPP
ncbi:MAG: trehalose-phosphatase [Geodermatophilaceae bacterium]|nr:trehalose-phosphatase [Geodermatophilaceae bacterium]